MQSTAAPTATWDPAATTYDDHPQAAIFPLISQEELQKLAEDICHYGQREDIFLFENKILDGRNRYRACLRFKIKPSFIQFAVTDPVAFVLSKNIHRRHLTKSQRAAIAADLLPMIETEARRRSRPTVRSHVTLQRRLSTSIRVERTALKRIGRVVSRPFAHG